MFRPIVLLAGLLAVLSLVATPAAAKSKAHPRPANLGYFSLVKGLIPGHRYKLSVRSPYHVHFTASLTEDYDWDTNHHFGQATRFVHYSGTAPRSFTFGQPVTGKLSAWRVALEVTDSKLRPLSVKVFDLGKHK